MKKTILFLAVTICSILLPILFNTDMTSANSYVYDVINISKNSMKISAAASMTDDICTKNPDTVICKERDVSNLQNILKLVVNTLLYILGAISVLVLVVGGLRYATSSGNEKGVTGAKNSIMYGVIGIVVALSAYAIVNYVVGKF